MTENMIDRFLAAPESHRLDIDTIAQVLEMFDQLSRKQRTDILQKLSILTCRDAAEAYMAIVNLYARSGAIPQLPIQSLRDNPRYASIFFPALLDFLHLPQLRFQILMLLLDYRRAGLIREELLSPIALRLLETYDRIKTPLTNAQDIVGTPEMWDEPYWLLRRDASILFDLFGYFPSQNTRIELRAALGLGDPRLKHFAILSLLRLGVEVDPKRVAEVAVDAEMRNWLFEGLTEIGRSTLYPKAYVTQAAFAESDLVNWLIYPTELGRAPDEIELMDVITYDEFDDHGIPCTLDYYVFRFRCNDVEWVDRGWMAGIAGPFMQDGELATRGLGETFSAFEPWESCTASEHANKVRVSINQSQTKNVEDR